jgi:hypothetical protein
MKRISLLVLLGIVLFGCQKEQAKKPVFLNPMEEAVVNRDSLLFEVEGNGWVALISTPIQVIYPQLSQNKNQLTVILNPKDGVIEGPAFLTLQLNDSQFIYPISLRNPETKTSLEELRTPKTVNTDSSMIQQQILYSFDLSGNLSELDEGIYFQENYLELSPKTGTFKSSTSTPVSSFYVDPGTVTEIPLNFTLDNYNKVVSIKAGPLVDKFENAVSNGTLVIFYLEKNGEKKRIEAVVQDSYCQLEMPLSEIENSTIQANIAQVYSHSLTIQQP